MAIEKKQTRQSCQGRNNFEVVEFKEEIEKMNRFEYGNEVKAEVN